MSIGRRRRQWEVGIGSGGSAPWVVSLPTIADLTGWTTALFPDLTGGSFKATYDGLEASAIMDLPATVDTTKPFQIGALFEYQGDARRAAVQLVNPLETSYLGVTFSINQDLLRIESGTYAAFNLAADVAPGDKFWIGLSWDATGGCCMWFCPVPTHGSLGDPNSYLNTVDKDYVRVLDKAFTAGSNGNGPGLAGMTQVRLANSSLTNKILSLFVRQGDFTSGAADRLEPPILTNPLVAGDTTALLRVPEFVVGDNRDLVVVFHGAGSAETLGSVDSGADLGVAIGHLVTAGYSIAFMRGTDDFSGTTYTGPKASNWGATASLNTWWEPFIVASKAKLGFRNIYFLGQSMGLVNALNMHALYPTMAKAIIGLSGVCNLVQAHDNEGFGAAIDLAYGAEDFNDFDPTQRPALYTDIPIKLWHGDSDATLDKVAHMDTFAAAVNALVPGSVVKVTVIGGDHLDASMYDGPAMLAFLQAHV